MSTPTDRRARKRLATRETISLVATTLFLERGFDRVTIDDIAEAADVGRMTVFNHFPRKEDLFFDREAEGRDVLRAALRDRDPADPPVVAMQRLAHRLVDGGTPWLVFTPESCGFVETVEGSEALRARARAIRDEIATEMKADLAAAVGRPATDPAAHLAADLLLATWTVALIEGHGTYRRTRSAAEAKASFLAIVDQGTVGLVAALAGTPYV